MRDHAVRTAAVLSVLLALAAVASAQLQEPEPADIVFRSLNGTTGKECTIQRLVIQESTMEMAQVGRIEPTGPVFTLRDVPLVPARGYIATAWFGNVPYYWEYRGRFVAQDTNTIHVFSTTAENDGVVVSGMNVIIKKAGDLVTLEYKLQLDNRIRPQTTVVNSTSVLEMTVPAGIQGVEAKYHRGPNAVPVETRLLGDSRLALNIPLTPGNNSMHLKARLPWQADLEIPIGCDLPVEAWSLLGSPEYLEFTSFELERDPDNRLSGVSRFVGPPLEAGREILVRVNSLQPATEVGEIFAAADSAPDGADDAEAQPEGSGRWSVPLPLLALAFVLIILIAVVRRRRSGDS